jgi:hypothetical protein
MKRGSREIGNGEGISIIASRHVRHRYRIIQNFRPVAIVAKPVDEQKQLGVGRNRAESGPKRRAGIRNYIDPCFICAGCQGSRKRRQRTPDSASISLRLCPSPHPLFSRTVRNLGGAFSVTVMAVRKSWSGQEEGQGQGLKALACSSEAAFSASFSSCTVICNHYSS